MRALFSGDFSSVSDYGYMARAYAEGLLSAGVDLLYDNYTDSSPRIALGKFWREQLEKDKARNDFASVKIWCTTPDNYVPSPAVKNIALVQWDVKGLPTYGSGKNNWVQQLNKMDLIWTPSVFAKQVMLESGVIRPVEVAPYPINTNLYKPTDGQSELFDSNKFHIHEDWFKFLSVFDYTQQADPASLILAYLSEFTEADQTALALRSYSYKAGGLQPIKTFIEKFRKELRLPTRGPRIFLVPGTLNDEEMAELMSSCHCSVFTTKGEGTARAVLQSLACGVPAVVPNSTAYVDHVNETNGYLVDVGEEPVNGMSFAPEYFCTQTWYRTDVMDLRKKMREAYEQRSSLEDKSRAAVESIHSVSTPTVGRQLQESLARLLDN